MAQIVNSFMVCLFVGLLSHCHADISKQIANVLDQLQKYSDDVDRKMTHMDDKVTDVKSQNTVMDSKLTYMNVELTDMDGKLTEYKSQNTATEQELIKDMNVAMETKLGSVIGYLSRLEIMSNSSQPAVNTSSCVRGAPHDKPRQKFLLWGRVPALCDTETDGGGWVIIQRRTKGNVDFYRRWSHYKKGFGNLQNDYWIGNDNIHKLTKHGYTTLRVDMEFRDVQYFAEYSNFRVAGKSSKYKLTVSGYHGDADDALGQQNDMYFSTYDNNNDQYPGVNCAAADQYHGGWWYKACTFSNLNGMWLADDYKGLFWYGVIMPGSVTWSEMKVRHV